MKFFFAIAAAAASLAFAAESGNLRATAAVENPVAKSVEARIQMGGLLHEPTKEELAVLDQTVLDTYNKVYNKLGKEAGSVDSKAAFINDEGVGSVVSFWMDWLTGECGPFCKFLCLKPIYYILWRLNSLSSSSSDEPPQVVTTGMTGNATPLEPAAH